MKKHPLTDFDADIREHIAHETEDNIARKCRPTRPGAAALRAFGNIARANRGRAGSLDPGMAGAAASGFPLRPAHDASDAGFDGDCRRLVGSRYRRLLGDLRRPQRSGLQAPAGGRSRMSADDLREQQAHWRSRQRVAYPTSAICARRSRSQRLRPRILLPAELACRSTRRSVYWGALVTANYFAVVKSDFAAGSGFDLTRDDTRGGPRVVVLSDDLWLRHSGGNRGVVGSQMMINPATGDDRRCDRGQLSRHGRADRS